MPSKNRADVSPTSSSGRQASGMNTPIFPQTSIDPIALTNLTNADEMEIKPGIAEMIREEERVSFSFQYYYFSFEIKVNVNHYLGL